MRMITAEENPSRGNIKIGKHDIESNSSEGFQYLGYCPQFDAVWRKITVREHLETYAVIRGVAAKDIKRFLFCCFSSFSRCSQLLYFSRLTQNIMEGLRIAEHADKRAEKCSGGTKRKLSYGMAMLGDPKIVLMDEPSTGMDPQSKRFVWDTILASFKV